MKKVIKWLDNFWYHNKWIVLIVAFFAVAIIIMTTQFVQKDKYDSLILYTGPKYLSAIEVQDIESAFEDVMTEDYDGNKIKEASLNPLFLMTDDQLKEKKYYTDSEGNQILINTGEMVTTKQQFGTQIFAGEAVICLLDPAWYQVAKKQDAFLPISEITDIPFEGMYDESSVYLKQTQFGKYFTALEVLPEDTLICFRRMSTASSLGNMEKESERYEYNKRYFKSILEFDLN